MRTIKLTIKIVAIALMLYIFMLQRKDYYAELAIKPVAMPPETLPVKTK